MFLLFLLVPNKEAAKSKEAVKLFQNPNEIYARDKKLHTPLQAAYFREVSIFG